MTDQPKPTLTMLPRAKALNTGALFRTFEKTTGRKVSDEEQQRCLAILNAHAERRQAAES
jgi:hypothetical protein